MLNSKLALLNVINNLRVIQVSEVEFHTLLTSKNISSNKNTDRVVASIRDSVESGKYTYQQIISYLIVKSIFDKSFLYSLRIVHSDVKKIDHELTDYQFNIDSLFVNRLCQEKGISLNSLFEPQPDGGTFVLDTLIKQNYTKPIYALKNLDILLAFYDNMNSENKRITRLLKQLKKTQQGVI